MELYYLIEKTALTSCLRLLESWDLLRYLLKVFYSLTNLIPTNPNELGNIMVTVLQVIKLKHRENQ